MTKVNILQDNNKLKSITIDDHAGFAEYGQDIVCAAISSIIFGTLNALMVYKLPEEYVEIRDAYIKIDLIDNHDIQVVANTMLIQLQTIQESYPDYIKIKTN